jgi:hypothetical protein
MDELTGALSRKLVERCSDAEAKSILLAACDSGNVYAAIQSTLDAAIPPKRERKRRRKAPPHQESKPGESGPGPTTPPARGKARKSLEQKCKEMAENYPDIFHRAFQNVGLGEPATDETRKLVVAEFNKIFRGHKKK